MVAFGWQLWGCVEMDSRDETLTSGKSGILTGFDVINRQHKNTPQEEFLPRKNVKTHENELYGDAACTTETNRHDIKIQTKLHLI